MFLIAAEKAITRRWLQRVSRTMEDWRGIISESYRGRNHSLLHKKTKGSEFMEEMGGFCLMQKNRSSRSQQTVFSC